MVKETDQLMRRSSADIERYQADGIHELLVYAARHSEFYHSRFAAVGLTKDRDLISDNLELIPLLGKHDLQQSFESLVAHGVSRSTWRRNYSGGSSGQTVVVVQDSAYRKMGTATTFISDRMQGWEYGQRIASLWGGQTSIGTLSNAKLRVLSYLSNSRLYDSFDMSANTMELYHRHLQRYQPDNIVAYAGSAYLFARYLLERKLSPHYPRISIISSAETLSDEMRSVIQQCFRVPVYNRYGSREVGCIASECRCRAGLHTHLDKKVEVLDLRTGKPVFDTPGRIVVTLLSNRALPLIRYDLGDIGIRTRKQCTCGMNTPMLQNVLGRTSDFIVTPSGRLIHGEYFTHVFYGRPTIKQFQFVQESSTRYTVRIVRAQELTTSQLQDIRQEITSVLGCNAEVRFEFPEHILPLPSGKFRFTISNITIPVGG
jgi:phenylacetate-CoA ligase